MPVEFLSEEQRERYGRFFAEPSKEQLSRYFHLSDRDHSLIRKRRGLHNRLGFALQLCTVRFLGTFLLDPTDVPSGVVSYVSSQLGIEDKSSLPKYLEREGTKWEHSATIQSEYGYKDFSQQPEHWKLVRWLYSRAWLGAERPSVLFDLATARLVEKKILLPGASVLSRLVASVRDRASRRLWTTLSDTPSPEQRKHLEALLEVPDSSRQSNLDRLRKAPTRVSAPSLVAALERVEEMRSYGASQLDLAGVPPSKLITLARYAAVASAQTVSRMPENRKIASLVAFARVFEATAMDDAMDVLDMLITEIIKSAELSRKKERLRTIRDLDAAALMLRDACAVILEDSVADAELRDVIFADTSKQELLAAKELVESLARPSNEQHQKELIARYRSVRRFLPKLLKTVEFCSTPAGRPVSDALDFLLSIEGEHKPDMSEAPLGAVPRGWQRLVANDGDV